MSKTEPQFAISERFLDQPYTLAGRLIDPVSGILSWQGKREHLRRKELEVLALLASADGKQVARDNFIAVVWQGNDLVGDRGLSNTIVFVRKSLRDEDAEHPLIRTIPRRGYQLAVPVQQPPELAMARALVQVEAVFVPGGMIPECPAWRLVKRLSQSTGFDSWLAEPSEFGERDQGLRVFRFCRSEAHLQRLRREVTLLRYLRDALAENQHFALIHDWQLDEPPYFLARDYTAFGNIAQWGGLTAQPLAQRMLMMQGLSDAVAAMHALGVVHRQLNAETILVDSSESGPQLKISAFDLAALSDRSKLAPLKITAAGLTVGAGEVGAELTSADDVVALSTVLLQLALGDLQAQPSAECLSKVADTKLQALLSPCFGPAPARPSASELAAQLRGLNTPEAASVAAIASTTEAVKTPTAIPKPLSSPLPVGVPSSIGNYHLLDRLGEGGMGTVYLAEQRAPVYRKVALKIIRAGLDGKQILSRFDAERQALAMMNHPNVAAVHESGMADDGRPFFAMEYIAGDDINSYCDAHHLNLSARIKLFLQVCDGVMHAHQKGVLHRDIKPSNLMVSQTAESAGTVKIIDFGLAKSLHGKLAAHTLHTSFGAFIGTPVYCSPEHISGSAGGVDTRSDIYSMGVVLYELLAGTTPIATESLENLEPEKVRELVCKSKLPSMREQLQNTSAEKRAAIAEHRSIKLDELPKTLEGDLSWVVGKCLERDPNDRYASVLELKKDLERWLELRPVEARPPSRWYRLRKMVRRNRGAVAIGVVLALALLTTTTAALIGFVRSERALEVARVSAREADMASEFQSKQMEEIDPSQMGSLLRKILLKEVDKGAHAKVLSADAQAETKHWLDQISFSDISTEQLDALYFQPALETIRSKYSAYPELQARLWHTLSEKLMRVGRLEEADSTIQLALEQRMRIFGAQDPETLESLRIRGLIRTYRSQLTEAESDLKAALEGMRKQLGTHDLRTIKAMSGLAQLYLQTQKTTDAISLLTEVVQQRRIQLGASDRNTLVSIGDLAAAYDYAGNIDQAMPLAKESWQGLRKLYGDAHEDTNIALTHYAAILIAQEQFGEAEQYLRQVLLHDEESLGRLHPGTLTSRSNLAVAVSENGDMTEAIQMQREVLEGRRKVLGPEHTQTLISQMLLGAWLGRNAEFAEGEALLRQVFAIFQKQLGEESSLTLHCTHRLGSLLRLAGRLGEAEDILRKTLAGREKSFGAQSRDTLRTLDELIQTLKARGKLEEAEKLSVESVAGWRKLMGESHNATQRANSILEEIRQIRAKSRLR